MLHNAFDILGMQSFEQDPEFVCGNISGADPPGQEGESATGDDCDGGDVQQGCVLIAPGQEGSDRPQIRSRKRRLVSDEEWGAAFSPFARSKAASASRSLGAFEQLYPFAEASVSGGGQKKQAVPPVSERERSRTADSFLALQQEMVEHFGARDIQLRSAEDGKAGKC